MTTIRFESLACENAGDSASDAPPHHNDHDHRVHWNRLRDDFVASHRLEFQDDANRSQRIPADLSFFASPEQLLLSYEKYRKTSELGRVFELANRWHDYLDAIVVCGDGQTELAAKSILQLCCDPFHNEGSRAIRGSKPRFYFANDDWDNDYLQSLFKRLALGGYGDQACEAVWSLIRLPGTQPAIGTLLMKQLPDATKWLDAEFSSRQLMIVAPADDRYAIKLREQGFPHHLFVPSTAATWQMALSMATLLPAAFLGLDCIQLLVGAANMNDHFQTIDYEQNMVLQLARQNHHDQSNTLVVWSSTMRALGKWTTMLSGLGIRNTYLGHELKKQTDQRLRSTLGNGTCNHLFVNQIRTDCLTYDASSSNSLSQTSTAKRSLSDCLTQDQNQLIARAHRLGIKQTTITLPGLQTNELGQFFQLLMLANATAENA